MKNLKRSLKTAVTFSGVIGSVIGCSFLYERSKSETVFLDQGRFETVREKFYHTPQGSNFIRADWLNALERPGTEALPFKERTYLENFGLIFHDTSPDSKDYPIGFAPADEEIGLNCAACHTADIKIKDITIRVDGAPARFDFDRFYQSLASAVSETLTDPDKFDRFAKALNKEDPAKKSSLRKDLSAYAKRLTADAKLRKPALASGYGRVDALTQIINALAVKDQNIPENAFQAAAPTSYPALWLTPELEYVQWSPIANNPIARNGGQVLGVFGNANLSETAGEDVFKSTILLNELHDMELWIRDLEPPKWRPEYMGKIDTKLAEKGKEIFAKECASCHNMHPYERTPSEDNYFQKRFIKIKAAPYQQVGTDPTYIENLVSRQIKTNKLTAPLLFNNQETVPALLFFKKTVAAALKRAFADASISNPNKIFEMTGYRYETGPDGKPKPSEPPKQNAVSLKAGPLAGVWATGPYLHNGSVPTIYELLSPEAERREIFWTGGKELDLERIGYKSDKAEGLFRFDTNLKGNYNTGHNFPQIPLKHEERMAVIEYLKTQ